MQSLLQKTFLKGKSNPISDKNPGFQILEKSIKDKIIPNLS